MVVRKVKSAYRLFIEQTRGIGGGGTGDVIIAQPFKGKKIIVIGNSIVAEQDVPAGQGWSTKLAARTGGTVIKYGYPGKPWSWKTALGATNTSIYSNRNSWDRTGDVYILYSGGNDPRLEIDKGVYTDTATDNNHMGTLRATVNLIRGWNPNAIVVIAISLPRDGPPEAVVKNEDKNLLGNSLMDHNAEARLLAYDMKCPVWDMFGIGIDYATDYQADRVHPNAVGSTKIADSGAGFIATLKLPAGAADTTAPGAPASLTSPSKTTTTVNLAWTAATDNPGGSGVTGYKVYRNGTLIATLGNVLSYQATGLTQSTAYTFTVRAVDAKGNEGPAATLSVTTSAPASDSTAPNVPAQPTLVSKTHNSVTLSWTAVSDNTGGVGVTNYIIEGGPSAVTVGTVTQTTITGLNPSTPYNFTLKARDANGNTSTASPALAVTTDAAPAGGPTVYYKDTFTGPNGSLNGHQPETGAPWDTSVATTPANWQLVNNAAKYTGTTGDKILVESGAPTGDYTLIYNVYAAGGKQGFAFRGLNGTNYLYVRYDAAAAGAELKLFKRSDVTGTATTTQLHAVAATINTTASHEIKIVVSGNNIKVYLEGSATAAMDFTLSTADATEYAGRTKFGMYAGGENTSQWNEVTVQSNAA
ncbi:fibronectin type III domain-containing protein [Paenibacillus caseinilyticus]|uniref:fibronectin type III domain-containing protein n=1 Tax=Paenibacillus caseinilyticus TaxID=3098138 RepID=UPI0022B87635|nr:fibronectin type III domain-containing protein [Paenibacillus caseinilyticus]MCZ8518898.1 fibronectin type III domain-containing protein [Paenibacillus caseinilyticus]